MYTEMNEIKVTKQHLFNKLNLIIAGKSHGFPLVWSRCVLLQIIVGKSKGQPQH